uniref:Endoglucanase n=1 Tax=Solanum lycopersicum TaxID=4081 RepID=A0A3Q7GIE9_SOLLC
MESITHLFLTCSKVASFMEEVGTLSQIFSLCWILDFGIIRHCGHCRSLRHRITCFAQDCLLQRLGDPTVYHVYREKNKLVDSLAVLDFYNRGSIPTVWTTTFSSPPPSTLVVLCADKQEEEFLRRINIASAHSSSMYIHGSPSSFSSAPVMDAIQGYSRKASDPNLFTCSLIGGPDAYDNFTDRTDNYDQTEPATYNNALFISMLARLHSGNNGYNQLLP